MMHRLLVLLSLSLPLASVPAAAGMTALPDPEFPNGFGVNIHFTHAQPGETEKMAAAFRVARMDFMWHATEKQRGVYDWSAYDHLVSDLEAHGIRPMFILDYGNDIYQQGPPRSPEARAAYAKWAAEAARRYKGHNILWEFWNEPNLAQFWGGLPPDPEEYATLVNEASAAMRHADPDATLLVGAFSGFPWEYMETAFRRGALHRADAVTVHPYRSGYPETAIPDYRRLHFLLNKYAPGRHIPILSGEWGYSTNTKSGVPEERQAQYLVRQRLVNASQGVNLSIWYDWKNDGPNPEENEHRFGSVREDLSPKPSYTAAVTLTKTLAGYRPVRFLKEGDPGYVLLLRNTKGESALAMWTTGPTRAFRVNRPLRVVDMLGKVEDLRSGSESRVLYFGASPRYVLMGKNADLDARTMWWWLKPNFVVSAGRDARMPDLVVKNVTQARRRYEVKVTLDAGTAVMPRTNVELAPGQSAVLPVTLHLHQRPREATARVTVRSRSEKGGAVEDTAVYPLIVANPLDVTAGPVKRAGKYAAITLDAPAGGTGEVWTVSLTHTRGFPPGTPVFARIPKGAERLDVRLPVGEVEMVYRYGVTVRDNTGRIVAQAPPVEFQAVGYWSNRVVSEMPPSGLSVHAEGASDIGGSVVFRTAADPERTAVPELIAEFPNGWRYFVVTPENTRIPEGAAAVGMWVNGDGSGDFLRCRFVDAKGQTYQPTYGRIDWTGWRWVTMRLDDPTVGSWGGPQDGVIHQPIKWDSLFLLDSATQTAHKAHIQFDGITVMTRVPPGD